MYHIHLQARRSNARLEGAKRGVAQRARALTLNLRFYNSDAIITPLVPRPPYSFSYYNIS